MYKPAFIIFLTVAGHMICLPFMMLQTNRNNHGIALENIFRHNLNMRQAINIQQLKGGWSGAQIFKCAVGKKLFIAKVLIHDPNTPSNELIAHQAANNIGLAPLIYYHDSSTIIMECMSEPTITLDQAQTPEMLATMGSSIRSIAQQNISLPFKDIFTDIDEAYNKLEQSPFFSPAIELAHHKFKGIKNKILSPEKVLTPCHGDLNPRNIFFIDKKLTIIDWENSGMCYPYYDLAGFSIFNCLNESQDNELLTHYFETTPLKEDIEYFRLIKQAIRIRDAFLLLDFIHDISPHLHRSVPTIRTFTYYQKKFAGDSQANSHEFIYAMALSQLQDFLHNLEM